MPAWSLEQLNPEGFFKKYFNTITATIVCFLLALVNKTLIAWVYTSLIGDKSLYLLFAKQIVEGKHPLEPLGMLNGQLYYVYNPAITSPLYSLLAAPLLWLTKSYYAASFVIDIFSWIIFFTGLYHFAVMALKERWLANLLILCTGFFLYPHELGSGPKDTFSIGCMCWISVLLIDLFNQPNVRKIFLLSLSIIALGLMKFLYTPLCLLFLLLLWIGVIKRKSRQHFLSAITVTVICIAAFIAFYSYLQFLQNLHPHHNVDAVSTVASIEKGFYPKNMEQTFPFISSALLNVNFWCVQLSDIFSVPFQTIGRSFQLVDLMLLIPVIFFLIQVIKKERPGYVWLIGAFISSAILFMLFYMSLAHEVIYIHFGNNWTYVQESRSYFFIIVFLQALLFYFIFRSGFFAAVKNLLFLLFIIECLHGFYFTSKQMLHQFEIRADNNAVERTVDFLRSANESASFAYLSTPDPHLRYYAQLHHIPVAVFSSNTCKTLAGSMEQPLIVALYSNSSFDTDSCSTGKTLVATDAIEPFELRLYMDQNHTR